MIRMAARSLNACAIIIRLNAGKSAKAAGQSVSGIAKRRSAVPRGGSTFDHPEQDASPARTFSARRHSVNDLPDDLPHQNAVSEPTTPRFGARRLRACGEEADTQEASAERSRLQTGATDRSRSLS